MSAAYRVKLLAFLLLLFTFFSLAMLEPAISMSSDFDPVKRAAPEKLLHISGQISSTLSVKIYLTYIAANSSCDIVISRIEGAYGKRTIRDEIPVQVKGNQYDAVVPLDKYQEGGYCQWGPFSIDFYPMKNGNSSPANLVWIQTPGRVDSFYAQDGTDYPKESIIKCHSAPDITCMRQSFENITTEAKELRVNIIEDVATKLPKTQP